MTEEEARKITANPCSSAWTTPRKEQIAYKWIINEAEVLLLSAKKTAISPPLIFARVLPFPLYLYINYDSANKRLVMCIGHKNLKSSETMPSVWLSKCYASIFDSQTQKVIKGIYFDEKEIVATSGVSSSTQNFTDLMPEDLRNLFYNGALVVHFTATLTSLSEFDTSTAGKGPSDFKHNPGYTMMSILGDNVFSDAKIKVSGKTFKVHRAILACQSDVFKRMFVSEMKEKKEGVVEIYDVDPDTMTDLLAYVYTGSAPNIKSIAKNLLFAADKYNLNNLAVLCEKELQTTLTTDNVADILLIADQLPLRVTLRDACMTFIKHHSNEVYQSSSWKTLKETAMPLALEVMEKAICV